MSRQNQDGDDRDRMQRAQEEYYRARTGQKKVQVKPMTIISFLIALAMLLFLVFTGQPAP